MRIGTVSTASGVDLGVIPDGSTGAIVAVDCAGAQPGDRVVLEQHATQSLAVAIVGGPHAGTVAADYIVESGTANGWQYDLYASGRLKAWGEFAITWAAGNNWYLTIQTPKTMADASYIPFAQISSWKVDQCYAGQRTPTQFQIAVTASGGGDTGTVFVFLAGFAA